MVRPRKCRRISTTPLVRFYKPQGVPVRNLQIVSLKEEELESLILADLQGLDQETAAARMEVSRSTFSRMLGEARHAVAQALAEGAALRIEGEDFAHEKSEMKGE